MQRPETGFITKILAPRSRAELVTRPRLLSSLDESRDIEVTAIVAPAGYGKTTLLLQNLAHCGLPYCWLTLDSYDTDPGRLLQYLILAFDQHLPGLAEALLPVLMAEEDGPRRLRECLARLVTAVHLQASEPFLLILDDIHVLDGSAASHEVLEPLLQHLPRSCRLLMAGRGLPELPGLHRLRACGQMERLDTTDLEFTEAEAHELIALLSGGCAPPEQEGALVAQLEGWAAGLAMMARSARRQRTPASDPARGLFGYLCAEAYDELPDARRRLLLLASVPRQITSQILRGLAGCDELGDREDDELEALQAGDLFIQRIDGPQPAYRFHQLYRDFLQDQLRRSDPAGYRVLHTRAAELLSVAGDWQEAVFHCSEARAWKQAAAILEDAAPMAGRRGQWRGLAAAIATLPADLQQERPALALLQARAWIKLGDVVRAGTALDCVGPALEREGPSLLLAHWLLLRGTMLRFSGNLEQAAECLRRSVLMLIEVDAPVSLVAEARRQLGTCAGMIGNFGDAQRELEASLAVFETAHDVASAAAVHDALGICLNRTGRPSDALVHYQQASQTWRALDNLSGLAASLVNAGTLYYEQGDQEQARDLLTQALGAARGSVNQRYEVYALLGLGDVALAGDAESEAITQYETALDRAAALGESFPLTYAACGLAENYRRRSELEKGESTLKNRLAELGHEGNRLERALCRLQLGLIARERHEYQDAVFSLTEAAGLFAHQQARRDEARTCFMLAATHFEQRRRRLVSPPLERVAEIVDELGSEQCILREARSAPMMIQYAAAHRMGNGLYSRLVHRLLERPAMADPQTEAPRLPRVVVRALGPMEVAIGDRRVSDLEWRSAASKELFLYMLNSGEQRKDEIASAVWPELEPESTNSQFHSNVYRVRQALFPESIVRTNGHYLLNPEATFDYDVANFERLLAEAEAYPRGSEQRAASLRDALRLYRGPFAEEFYSEWAAVVRDRLEDGYLRATASLAGYHAGRGEYEASVELCQRILSVDRYHEGATLELMRARAGMGDVPEALRVYRRYADLLRDEGIGEPPAVLTRLQRSLAADLGAAV